jgi:hypothetical protein
MSTLPSVSALTISMCFSKRLKKSPSELSPKKFGQDVLFASVEDLIIHKIFSGRPRDMEDVRIILLKNQDIDTQYIENWLMEFDAAADEKIFLSAFRALLK